MPEPFAQVINARTCCCAVLGHPISHSASPAMQNAGISALGLNWRYLAFDVRPEDLRWAIEGARRMHFIGLNLTVPHKVLALELVDHLDASARTWGAVNTVRFEGRAPGGDWRPLREFADPPQEVRSHGFNTDAEAIARTLREDLSLEVTGLRVLLLGAGGAGHAAALKLAADGAKQLFLVNRTESKAVELAAEIRQRQPETEVCVGYPPGPVDLVINATSLGLNPADPSPLDSSRFDLASAGAVFDMIYRPAETPLVKAARAAGCRAVNGLGMLLYQGVKALELWTGLPAPVEVMRRALHESIYG